ncbi:E3 ubiquitin-protein ligase RNF14 isoform X1 [Herrania umbratica]|uniref:RBR-type E3 ubiquitin transferase n=1 Tax=Herrania umbratica TaxID=108875 RepID=A0A6J1AZ11_9ROSI|nr:E3 ubiquitin-protein ligase RNF14 isoform X1 [Herrania umbratica]
MRRTRGGSRQGHHHHQPLQAEETWSVKPFHDTPQPPQQDPHHQQEEPNLNFPSSPSISHQLQSLDFTPKPSRTHRNPNWKYRRGHVAKPRFVKKSELISSKSELSSEDNKASLSVVEEVNCDEEENKGSEALESKIDGDGEEIEGDESQNSADGVVSRFEELRLRVDEPELSEERLRINDQLQEDELLAMKSIYGENVFILDREMGLRSLKIHIHLEGSGETIITTKLNSSNDVGESETSDDFSYSFKVQYLPPIVLTCLLPRSYPSHLPPYFTISVQWLHSARISDLCSHLDLIWKEQEGREVIYQWADWLQNFSLSYLGCDKEIMLGPYGIENTGERRAISGSVSPVVDVPFVRSYNDEICHEKFLKSLHECSICFSEYAGTDFIRLPCQHFFCCKCIKTYSDMHITKGTISKLLCPEAKCGGMVPPGLLKRLLSDEAYERWESLMLQKTLESMSDVACCPRCETPCIEDEDQHAQCSKCFFSFCTLCRERRHVGIACMTPELKLRILQERQNSSQLNQAQKLKEREMINEILSMKEIMRDAKQCPSCKMAISKTEGCNKMVCENCGQYFCYRCNKAINGYDHFRDGTCELFPQEMIRDWEERLNARQVLGQVHAQLFAERGQPCPNCRQFNAKVDNNNHIFCWACQTHYCYLCKKIVRRSSQHYGPKGCKQHTEG